jgi:hypothetical protein
VSGPRQRANGKLFEAVRPSCYDLANKAAKGSKSSQNEVRRGCAKVSYFKAGDLSPNKRCHMVIVSL